MLLVCLWLKTTGRRVGVWFLSFYLRKKHKWNVKLYLCRACRRTWWPASCGVNPLPPQVYPPNHYPTNFSDPFISVSWIRAGVNADPDPGIWCQNYKIVQLKVHRALQNNTFLLFYLLFGNFCPLRTGSGSSRLKPKRIRVCVRIWIHNTAVFCFRSLRSGK